MLAALAGCGSMATGPTLGETQASLPPAPQNGVRLYFYRPYNYIASAGNPTVLVDDVIVADATLSSVLYCDVAPGRHTVQLAYRSEWRGRAMAVAAGGGGAFYLQIAPGFPTNDYYSLDAMGPNTGASDIQSLHLIEARCPAASPVATKGAPKAEIEQALADGAAAENRGDRAAAIAAYTAALGKHPEGIAGAGDVVNRAIDDALILNPPPAVPAGANSHAAAALKIIESAKTKADLGAARQEYQAALALAPWWADAWFNLATLDEQIAAWEEAQFALQTYLRAAPNAPDKDRIQKKIEELRARAAAS